MGFLDIFWMFLIISSLQPVIRQRMLDAARQRMIAKIEEERNSRVILLVHRQESMNFLGFPVVRFINIDDSEEVIRAIHLTDKQVPLDIILHTPGGLVLAALQIARAIKQHPGKVTVHVPHYAMSGGTLIAMAADEVVMAPHAVLGPVDPQLGNLPGPSLVKVVKQKPIAEVDDQTLIYADIAEKAINQLRDAIIELLDGKKSPEEARKIAEMMTEGRWTHDYPITPEAAKAIGLPINTEMPDKIYQLMSLYPQPVKRQPTVEYLPEPHPFSPRQKNKSR
jgi:ClpP class serine protease